MMKPDVSGAGKAHMREGIRRASSMLRLRHTGANDIGSMQEIRTCAASAREELRPFAAAKIPEVSVYRALKFGISVYNFRHVALLLPSALFLPFTYEVIRIGGLERVHLLLAMARFDLNGDGIIDGAEYELSRMQGEKLVVNAVSGCANFAIISALLFGATHLTTIGRPKPWHAGPESVDKFGTETTTNFMYGVYTLNVAAQCLALAIIITSIFSRQLLCNALPSVMSKLAFLSDTNLLANMGTACTWMIAFLCWVVFFGGFLSVPTYGFISMALLPMLLLIIIPTIYPAFLKTAMRLHLEVNALFACEGQSTPVAPDKELAMTNWRPLGDYAAERSSRNSHAQPAGDENAANEIAIDMEYND